MIVGAIALGLGLLLLAVSRFFPLSLLAMMICGAGGVGMAVTANTTIQLHVPDQLRGRVMSVYTTVFSGSVPAGGIVMGAIASNWGVPPALLLGGVIALAVGLLTIPWYRRIAPQARAVSPRSSRGAASPVVAAAAADISAIDPEGRAAGSMGSGVRTR
jgi:MFS family permease